MNSTLLAGGARRPGRGRDARSMLALAGALALAFAGCRGGADTGGNGRGHAAADAAAEASAARWLCPMHPTYTADHPGSCPICGMDLVEAAALSGAQAGAAGGMPGLAALELDDRGVRLAGVRTQAAAVAPLRREIRAVGTVGLDQARQRSVQARVSGWIETMSVAAVGERVARGAPLLTIYSPELVATQEELLRARALAAADSAAGVAAPGGGAGAAAAAVADAARRRLTLLGVDDAFVAALEKSGRVSRAVPLRAPAAGIVTARGAWPGMAVEPGQELLQVTDLDAVWVDARFYEYEARHVAAGLPVTVRLPQEPGLTLAGVIDYVYPTIDETTRTLTARIVLGNDFGQLRPGAWVEVRLASDLGPALLVPDDAVLDTGVRKIVFVATGGGRFEPREITVGERAGGQAQVLAGLEPGEQVVVKAAFLLDSESRLRAALLPPPGEPAAGGHGGHDGREGHDGHAGTAPPAAADTAGAPGAAR